MTGYSCVHPIITPEQNLFSQLVMGCDLVSTVLFVFCHIVSTITKIDEEGNEGKYIPDGISSGIEITCIIWIISK